MSAGSGQIEIENVSKRFDAVTAVNSVTLTIPSGRFFSLLGPSGCGKTTLLRLLSGFEYADSGTIRIADAVMNDVPPNRRPTALVFQRWALFPHLTVLENVCYGLRVRKVKSKAAAARADELLQLVGLTGLSRRKPAQLSGGQQQRVALARALAIEPKVLLLDEPLSSLDLKLRAQMQLELKRLQRELGMTFVYVTHDQGEAMTMSDTVAVMNQGSMIQAGAPLDIYDHPTDAFVASFIGDTNLFDLGEVAAHTGSVQTTGMVSLRYERVQVGQDLDADVRLAAHVREVIFAGSTIRYLVGVDGTEVQLYADIAHQGESRLFAMGAAVEVGWQADAPVPVGGAAP